MTGEQEVTLEGTRALRVLVVDDNRDGADTLSVLLRLWGFEVRAIYTGAGALEVARGFRPDCMLMDIGLPDLDGYQLAEHVRQDDLLKGATLIAITAYSDEARARAAGFDHHLLKPADPLLVEAMLRKLQDMGKRLNQTEQLVEQQMAVAAETRELIRDVRDEMKEVKQELREVKEEVKEVKEEIKEVKEELREVRDNDRTTQ